MKYYYVVYETRNDKTGKWIKNSKGMQVDSFDFKGMKELLMKEEKTEALCILNFIKLNKREYKTIG